MRPLSSAPTSSPRPAGSASAARRRRDRRQGADQALVGVAGGEAEEEAATECGHLIAPGTLHCRASSGRVELKGKATIARA